MGHRGVKCNYHPDREATGICKCCSRGLCADCQVDVGNGLACRDKCEDNVRAVNAYVEQNMRTTSSVFKSARRTTYYSALFFAALGTIFFSLGYIYDEGFQQMFGGLFVVYGGFTALRTYASPAPYPHPPGRCQKCGYDLKGTLSSNCPECGNES